MSRCKHLRLGIIPLRICRKYTTGKKIAQCNLGIDIDECKDYEPLTGLVAKLIEQCKKQSELEVTIEDATTFRDLMERYREKEEDV